VRGEHLSAGTLTSFPLGSSPRARVARVIVRAPLPQVGIIPACAGSTAVTAAGSANPRDHPRVRGEHDFRHGSEWEGQGSSPRARGALEFRAGCVRVPGIIPACAGSTFV